MVLLISASAATMQAANDPVYFWSDGFCFYVYLYGNPYDNAYLAPDSSYLDLSGTITIPETVTTTVTINGVPTEKTYHVAFIAQKAFKDCTGITGVNLPSGLTNIYDNAFEGCTGLTSIDFPETMKYIGTRAFSGCSGISSILIPENVTFIGSYAFADMNLTSIVWNAIDCPYSTGWDASNVTSLTIGDKVQQIPTALMKNGKITSLDLPLSVKKIGGYAFQNCTELTEVTIPDSITYIGIEAFSGCAYTKLIWNAIHCENASYMRTYNVTEAIVGDNVEYIPEDFIRYSKVQSIELPSSVKTIGDYAFGYCRNLKDIQLSYGLENIGEWVFCGCDSLEVVNMPNTVTSIGAYAFYFMKSLTTAILPPRVQSVGEAAFMGNLRLTNVGYIPRTLTSIGNVAFCYIPHLASIYVESGNPVFDSRNNCNAIIETATNKLIAGTSSTVIPNTVKIIGYEAFYRSPLDSINIPEGVEVIEDRAFDDGTLDFITLPSTLKSIGCSVFYYNITLYRVTCLALEPPTVGDAYCFYPCIRNGSILYVPEASFEAYKQAEYWKDFLYIIPIGHEPLRGDMDQDGVISIADLSDLIDFILAYNSTHIYYQNPYADVDNNGSYGISDISALIDIILCVE